MPVYEFICRDSHRTFSVTRPMSEAASAAACPSCGSSNTERTWSTVFAKTSRKS
jgi:putative FmdB family regulatory protein